MGVKRYFWDSEVTPVVVSIFSIAAFFVLFLVSWLTGMNGLPLALLFTVGPLLVVLTVFCLLWEKLWFKK